MDPNFVTESSYTHCGAPCTIVQNYLSNAQMRVPSLPGTTHGVVTSWRVRGTDGSTRLRRIAVTESGHATALGVTAPIALDGTNQEIPASLPVETGDALGLDLSDEDTKIAKGVTLGADEIFFWLLLPDDAQNVQAIGEAPVLLAYQAMVEPDVDADGLGDETQDSCVQCSPDGPDDGDPGDDPQADPYAAIRKDGPKVRLAGSAKASKGVASLKVTNPYAFALKGRLVLKSGRKAVGKAAVKLAANGSRTVKVRLSRSTARLLARRSKVKLTAAATMQAPVGKVRTTARKVTVKRAVAGEPAPSKPGASGYDGRYKGTGARADWVLTIEDGIVQSFNGTTSLYCTKSEKQQRRTFAMVGDDPKPKVSRHGSFAWQATKGYGMQQLKFSGGVTKQGKLKGRMMVEYRPMVNGADPVTGMPRIEFDYCFVGEDFTLMRR
jgi:hypothetical protein